jgi:peptide/nickel transport system permease protein
MRGRLRNAKTAISTSGLVGLVIVAVQAVLSLLAPLIAPYSPTVPDPLSSLEGPSPAHLLGTDPLGRDVLSRVLYGGRYALGLSLSAAALAVGLGALIGCYVALAAATRRHAWLDETVMRVVDAVLSVPSILALLVVVSVLGTGVPVIILAATVVWAAALSVVPLDYVTSARSRGESSWAIVRREIWPNVLDVVMVEFAMRASWIVLLISALSFLGFGANPPTPDWGLMIAENRTALAVIPWATLAPIIALATLIIGFNLAADGLAKARGVDRALAAGAA